MRKLELRPYDTPNDARRPKHLRARANKPVRLVLLAYPFDVREHPRLHAELHRACDDRCDCLRAKHRPRRDLHIVSELEVRRELQRLRHGGVTPGLEQHHSDRTAREGVPDDELSDDVQPDLLVRDRLDHADRYEVDEGCITCKWVSS